MWPRTFDLLSFFKFLFVGASSGEIEDLLLLKCTDQRPPGVSHIVEVFIRSPTKILLHRSRFSICVCFVSVQEIETAIFTDHAWRSPKKDGNILVGRICACEHCSSQIPQKRWAGIIMPSLLMIAKCKYGADHIPKSSPVTVA